MADNGQESGSELATNDQKSSEVTEKAKQVTNTAKNVGKEMLKGKGSMLAPLVHILVPCIGVLVFIIIIIGIIMFFLTMPGMVMENLKALFSKMGHAVAAFFGADTTTMIEDEDIYETLDYLEEMGYDLKGYGFITDFKEESDADEDGEYLDKEQGVIRDENDKIADASSTFISTYLVSDNYVYTLKNKNVVTQDPEGGWISKVFGGVKSFARRYYNFFFGPIMDRIGITEGIMSGWGRRINSSIL